MNRVRLKNVEQKQLYKKDKKRENNNENGECHTVAPHIFEVGDIGT
jgi:hypothetical protein